MPELHEAVHQIGDIAKATGVSANTIRTWFRRGDLLIEAAVDVETPGERVARKLSGRTALAIAVMGALTGRGVDPATAASAANVFAHLGDQRRDPGELFKSGWTVLMVYGGDSEVVNFQKTDRIDAIFAPALYNRQFVVTAVLLDGLVLNVCKRLGIK